MSAVWRMDIATTDKMVLLALADAASDEGVTWIALRSKREDKLDLMKKCSLSDRAIQAAIKRLCEAGYLAREERPGRGVIYKVTPERGSAPTPEAASPPPERGSGAPEGGSGNPSLNHQSTVNLFGGAEDFETFWRAYPNKKAKPRAEKAFIRAIKKTNLATMLAAVERAKASPKWTKSGGEFIPHPSTWLNDEGWNDAESVEPPKPERGMPGDRWAFC